MAQAHSKRIVLGITGGIAAYKAAELTRLLVRAGHSVQVVMTEAATHFIGTATLQALSGQAVLTTLWQNQSGDGMAHIDISRNADAILIAPASANFIAKLAHGLADDLLSTLCLARTCPLALAPAMNQQMWLNPATQRNLAQLREDGIALFGPESGAQACGEIGMGRMCEAEILLLELEALLQPKHLLGRTVLVTAGPTLEAIDPVRAITNLSSGKMGYAIARAAWEAGAEVILVSGPTALTAPPHISTIAVRSAEEMRAAVMSRVQQCDVFISVAAVADYRPTQTAPQKIKKQHAGLTLTLSPNPDILAEVAALPQAPFCVGFAAETEHLADHARAKRAQKKLPLLVANRADITLNADDVEVFLFEADRELNWPSAPKLIVGRMLMEHIASLL